MYRAAYGRRVQIFPRQCVFFGTTNDDKFLKDKTGNRRYWPVITGLQKAKKNIWTDMNQHEIDQIWAEAFYIWKAGEDLYLDKDMERFLMYTRIHIFVNIEKNKMCIYYWQ